MNPLDKEELKAFFKIVKNDMPVHTDRTAKIKHTQYKRFPKSLFQESIKIDNKFLNNNLHTIEEMEYRKKGITNDFKNYQHKYYDESGILNHDLYFEHEGTTYPKLHGACGFIINPYIMKSSIGADLTGGNTDGHGQVNGFIDCTKMSIGIIGNLYDRIAVNIFSSGGNYRLAAYQNDGGSPSKPDTLDVESADTVMSGTGFVGLSVTEWALVDTQIWSACQTSTSGGDIYAASGTLSNQEAYKGQGYGAYPNPIVTPTAASSPINSKIYHS